LEFFIFSPPSALAKVVFCFPFHIGSAEVAVWHLDFSFFQSDKKAARTKVFAFVSSDFGVALN